MSARRKNGCSEGIEPNCDYLRRRQDRRASEEETFKPRPRGDELCFAPLPLAWVLSIASISEVPTLGLHYPSHTARDLRERAVLGHCPQWVAKYIPGKLMNNAKK